ncbi:MAG: hypothetical protein ABI778_06980, partial [Ignavibacteriota bacterium]
MNRFILIVLFLLSIAPAGVLAQGTWVPFITGIGGKPPMAASFMNEKIGFVETQTGWYRTVDSGKTWVLTRGLGLLSIVHLNFFYNSPDNIIVNGSYESLDGGLNWKKIGNPTLSESIYEKDGVIYDADGRFSLDNTANWRVIMNYSGGEAIVGNLDKGIAMWGGTTFGSPPGSTLFTTDGGFTWKIGATGIEADFGYAFPFTLTYLRAGGDGDDAIERTTDGGATWTKVFRQLQHGWYLTDGIKGDGCVVYAQTDTTHFTPAGVLRSTDMGLTWQGIAGPTCTDDAPIIGVCSRGSVCFAMDYFTNGNNTIWKYSDPLLRRPAIKDLTIDRLFGDSIFVVVCDTAELSLKLHFSACDYVRFHDLLIDSISASAFTSFFSLDTLIHTGIPASGRILLMPQVPGTYRLKVRIRIAASDWAISDTTLSFVLVVNGDPPKLKITVRDTVNFGAKQICLSGDEKYLLLSNPNCQPLTATQVRFEADTEGLNAFTVSMPLPYVLVRGKPDGKITIMYHPKSAGIKKGKIIIVTTTGIDTIEVYANALPDTAKLTITKNRLIDFGIQPLCQAGGRDTLYLSDSSCITLKLLGVIFEADSSPPAEFIIGASTPVDLQFGKPPARVIVIFKPTTSGLKTGRIIIRTSIGDDTIPVRAGVIPDGRTLSFSTDTLRSPICDSMIGTITIRNRSCRVMSLDSMKLAAPFALLPRQLPSTINSGDSVILKVRFAPSLRGLQKIQVIASVQLYIQNGSVSFDTTMILIGDGLRGAAAYSLSRATVNFDTLSLCDRTSSKLALYSTGCDSLTFSLATLSGDPDFIFGTSNPLVLSSGDSLTFIIFLRPTSIGDKAATITLIFGDSSRVTIPVTATIARVKRVLSEFPSGTIDFGTVRTCENSDTLITLKNPSCDTIIVTSGLLQGAGYAITTTYPIKLLPGESRQIKINCLLDTVGGTSSNTATLDFQSDADNMLGQITLLRKYNYPHPVRLWLDAGSGQYSAGNVWKVKLKGNPT